MACVKSCVTPEARCTYQGRACDVFLVPKAKHLHVECTAETLDLGSHAKGRAEYKLIMVCRFKLDL